MKEFLTFFCRTLSSVALAFAMFSCSESNDLSTEVADERVPITFSVNTDGATRGSIIAAADFTSFTLYAYEEGSDEPFIDGALFTLDGTTWSSESVYYWPADAKVDIEFFAYTPAHDDDVSYGLTFNRGVITYDMSGLSTENQPDITVAYNKQAQGSVSLSFSRIVSIVRIGVKGEGADIEAASVSGIYSKGSFDILNYSAGWYDLQISEGDIYPFIIKEADESYSVTASNGYLMTIPQSVEDAVFNIAVESFDAVDLTTSVNWTSNTLYSYYIENRNGVDGWEEEEEETLLF